MAVGDSIIAEVLGSYVDMGETPYLEFDARTPVTRAPLSSVILY